MKKNKGLYAILGFLIASIGLLSVILNLIGAQFIFMKWISALPGALGFLIQVIMLVTGLVIMYLALTNPDREEFME